jgi:carbon starvation protein CstA
MVFPFLLVAAGAGPGFTLLNTAGLAAVSSERSGQAAGIIYMFRFGGGTIGIAAASALHAMLFHRQLVFRLAETPLSLTQQKLLEQPGAAERIGQIDSGLVANQAEQVRQAFHESFAAAFTGTLRLNVIFPIAICILLVPLMGRRKGRIKN